MWSPILCARVALRDLREPDLEAFSAYRSDPVVARYQSFSPPFTLDDARAFLAGIQATTFGAAGTWYQIAIADKETDSLLGDLAVHFLEEEDQVEIGFTLARASQGRGIAREALRGLVDHLFGPMAKRRVTALTDARNEGAIRLLTSLGFRQEAHYRQNAFFKGAYCDELLFACLRSEWPGQAGA